MKYPVNYLVILSLILSCVCNSIPGNESSRAAARGLSVSKGNSGHMSVDAENLLSESEDNDKNLEHDLTEPESPKEAAVTTRFESSSEKPSIEPPAILNAQPKVPISSRIYDILSGVGVLLTMLMYQIASYYWNSFTSSFRFLRNTDEQHQNNLAGVVTDAIDNIGKKFGL